MPVGGKTDGEGVVLAPGEVVALHDTPAAGRSNALVTTGLSPPACKGCWFRLAATRADRMTSAETTSMTLPTNLPTLIILTTHRTYRIE
jgi:hypothetical protein